MEYENNQGEIPQSSQYKEIEWPRRFTREAIKNDNKFKLIKMLCLIGEVVEWNPDAMDGHYPLTYLVKEVRIKFLPTATKVKVGEIYTPIPNMDNLDSLNYFIDAISKYNQLQKIVMKI